MHLPDNIELKGVEAWKPRPEHFLRYHPTMSNWEFLSRFGRVL